MPKASNFFLTYIILQGLSGTAGGFLQVVPLILYYVKIFLMGSTPRSIYGIKYTLRNVSWGTLFPVTTLLVVITIAYMVISPIINGLACFSFFMFYMLWKYLFLWQLDQPRASDTGGLFFPKALQHVFVGLYIQQICLAALFFLAQNQDKKPSAIPEGALMIVLIVFTAFFHVVINNSYGPLLEALPLSLADKTKGIDGRGDNREEGDRELSDRELSDRELSDRESVKGSDVARIDGSEKLRQRKGSADTGDSDDVSANGKGKAKSLDDAERGSQPSDTDSKTPKDIKAIDEEGGPKEFYHPAGVEPQRIVWLPRDGLGLAEAEAREIEQAGILVSLKDARMDEKGHVDIDGPPPGGDVRTL